MPNSETLTPETLTIEKLVYGGEGLARMEGRVVLTPFVLPGETVCVEINRAKNDLWRGRLIEVLEPSPLRMAPRCPYFQRCGGCHYQHIDYAAQLEQKRTILREVLQRVGKIEFAGEIGTIAGEPWQYRNRVQLHLQDDRVGYFGQHSRDLVAIDHCPIASPKLNETIGQINTQASTALELFTNETDVQVNVVDRVPRAALTALASLGVTTPIEYAGFQVSRNSFFQVNRFLIDRLVQCATGDAKGEWALDLYAGVGLFSKKLAERFAKVTAVESGGSSFRDLEHNFPAGAQKANVEEYLAVLEQTPDFILADPPRAGLGKQVVRELGRIRAPRVTIVSCDPATLARDLNGLFSENYAIEKITLVDLFPQTFHLETVVELFASGVQPD
ncbi:MAG TPA: class I SAM-dependent RNA methyltransferase [Tepidisphaeraceae bacterium]|nr:class I SAM-dependent RNA methyltransferase [Tepidisphaeraceae bacterium]